MITKRINDDFEYLQEVVSSFEICRDVDTFDRTFDFEVWSKDLDDVEKIKCMLQDLQKYENNLKQIRNQEIRGMIQVLAKKLQNRLQGRVKEEHTQVR
jgi:rubrerythrin